MFNLVYINYLLYFIIVFFLNLLKFNAINNYLLYFFQIVFSVFLFIYFAFFKHIRIKKNVEYKTINILILIFLLLFFIFKILSGNHNIGEIFFSVFYNLCFVALFEEYVFRNVYLHLLMKAGTKKKAILFNSVLFSIMHIPTIYFQMDFSNLFSIMNYLVILFIFSCIQCILILKSGSLLFVSLLHFINNEMSSECFFVIILIIFLVYGLKWFKNEC